MDKINFKIFRLLWPQIYDGRNCGTKIIKKSDISLNSDFDVPVIWFKNDRLGAIVISFLVFCNNKAEEFTFLSYNGQKSKTGHFIDRKFFGRIKGDHSVFPVITPLDYLESINATNFEFAISFFKEKEAELNRAGFLGLIEKCIANRPNRHSQSSSKARDEKSTSVRTISGGLYGLGKNRKH